MTAARAHAIFGKCMIQAPHEPEPLELIANMIYVAMVVVGYGIAAVFSPQTGRFLRIEWLRRQNSNRRDKRGNAPV